MCFGYKDGDNLWTYSGDHVGKFKEDNIYDRNGHYLGEVKNGNRLITSLSGKNWTKGRFTPYARRTAYVKHSDYAGNVMYVGYEDFTDVNHFK